MTLVQARRNSKRASGSQHRRCACSTSARQAHEVDVRLAQVAHRHQAGAIRQDEPDAALKQPDRARNTATEIGVLSRQFALLRIRSSIARAVVERLNLIGHRHRDTRPFSSRVRVDEARPRSRRSASEVTSGLFLGGLGAQEPPAPSRAFRCLLLPFSDDYPWHAATDQSSA